MKYFAYGSNMDAEQISNRLGETRFVCTAYLPNFTLVFNRKGTYRPGGVASIEKEKSSVVHGIVWQLSEKQMQRMDQIEDKDAYFRAEVNVVDPDDQIQRCMTYIAYPEGHFPPDEDYLELIKNAAIENGFPETYINFLKSVRVRPTDKKIS